MQTHDAQPMPRDASARLVQAIRTLFEQVPQIQRRYRAALERIHPDEAQGLAEAWSGFHYSLVVARYEPATRMLFVPDAPAGRHAALDGEALTRAVEIAAEVSQAHALLRDEIEQARFATPVAQPATRGILLSRWRLVRHGEARLRAAVAAATGALDPRDTPLVRHLPPLAAWFIAYLEADLVLSRNWPAFEADPTRVRALEHWLHHLADARERVEQLVIAPRQVLVGPPPEPPPPPPAGTGAVAQGGILAELTAAMEAVSGGYAVLVGECRRALAALGSEQAEMRLRSDLVAAWGRYDDALSVLGESLARVAAGGGPTIVVDVRARLVACGPLREEFLARLAAAQQWLARREIPPLR